MARAAGSDFRSRQGLPLKVFLNGRQSTLSMHGSMELGRGLVLAIKRHLQIV
jgi:mRNA interferase HicA